MDEKEKSDIEKRGYDFASKCDINEPVSSRMTYSYIQGALDQDPISRKKRTEEIIQELESYVDGHMDAPVVTWCIEKIKALP